MDLNTHVKSVIDLTTCPVHNQKPLLAINDDRITFECCCLDFKIICMKKVIKLLEEDRAHLLKFGWKEYD
jgi:hypothetical protein